MKPLENIVDINHSGFYPRKCVAFIALSYKGMYLSLCDFGFDARRRRERNAIAFVEFKCIVTDIARFFCSGHRRL